MRRLLIMGVLVTAVFLGTASQAFASIGVGTDMRSIEVTQPLAAGGTYEIHPFTIINTGSQASGFGIQLSATSKPGPKVPPGWLSFKPSAFYLTPKRGTEVAPTLTIPLDANPGTYKVLLLGVPKLPGDLTPGGHMNVGVGPLLTFSVVQPNWWQWLYFTFLSWMPWSGIAAIVIAVLLVSAAWLVVWRRRMRRPSGYVADESIEAPTQLEDVTSE